MVACVVATTDPETEKPGICPVYSQPRARQAFRTVGREGLEQYAFVFESRQSLISG